MHMLLVKSLPIISHFISPSSFPHPLHPLLIFLPYEGWIQGRHLFAAQNPLQHGPRYWPFRKQSLYVGMQMPAQLTPVTGCGGPMMTWLRPSGVIPPTRAFSPGV